MSVVGKILCVQLQMSVCRVDEKAKQVEQMNGKNQRSLIDGQNLVIDLCETEQVDCFKLLCYTRSANFSFCSAKNLSTSSCLTTFPSRANGSRYAFRLSLIPLYASSP